MEIEPEKHEFMGKKLHRRILVGKNGGPSTPPCAWRLQLSPQNGRNSYQEFLTFPTRNNSVSARKLCAYLWETQPHRRHLRRRQNHKDNIDKLQPVTTNSLRRPVAASPMQTHSSVRRNDHVPRHVSPGRYSNSVEVACYDDAVTPASSLDFIDRLDESRYSVGTSTEFVKILGGIWSLKDHHASNATLVKALRAELDHHQERMKDMVGDKQRDRQKMDDLLKDIVDIKLDRKYKEQDGVNAVVQLVRGELEDERKLRKNLESLHRKLARELSQVKCSLSIALKELRSERRTRILLENLCAEFAKGIRDYDAEVQRSRSKASKIFV